MHPLAHSPLVPTVCRNIYVYIYTYLFIAPRFSQWWHLLHFKWARAWTLPLSLCTLMGRGEVAVAGVACGKAKREKNAECKRCLATHSANCTVSARVLFAAAAAAPNTFCGHHFAHFSPLKSSKCIAAEFYVYEKFVSPSCKLPLPLQVLLRTWFTRNQQLCRTGMCIKYIKTFKCN